MKLQKLSCPICRHKNINNWCLNQSYYKCNYCEVVWTNNLKKVYYPFSYYQNKNRFIKWIFYYLNIFFSKIRAGYARQKNCNLWIDVGAGDGFFLNSLESKNKIAVENSKASLFIIKKLGVDTISVNTFLKKKLYKADVISFWHVLEHVDNPNLYIQASRNNLAKNGQVIISLPNIDCLEYRIFKKDWFHYVPEHNWYFTIKSLQILLKNNNLIIEKIDYIALEHHLAGTLQSFINKFSKTKNSLHKLLKRNIDNSRISTYDQVSIIFWLTMGFPLVIFLWIISILLKKSGAIVIVARLKHNNLPPN